ncbi:hypothetical protein [Thiobacter aerophilum]|uniref:DUF302 domain-containing protein n=1 Tax=Thiobacter aerophilum TaxID=3121275 RepID=A0ABV0EFJ4_9BURK
MKRMTQWFAALCLALMASVALADDLLKPFVLASKGPGDQAAKVEEVKKALTAHGFQVVGAYSPYANTTIIAVTNDELKRTAAQSEHGGFGAAMRVAVVKVGDEVQVSYTNPPYWAHAYRMKGDLKNVAAALEKALGRVEEFGAKGLSASKLRKYHYMVGMEYFDEPSVLAEYKSYEDGVRTVEANLAKGVAGVTKVYRIDIPGKQETVFGVAMKGNTEADKYMDDKYIMSEIDFKDVKSAAHLPYEILVSGNKAYALYARFRIAISFPDLSMMGKNSFMNIMKSPEAIRKALTQAAGGTVEEVKF